LTRNLGFPLFYFATDPSSPKDERGSREADSMESEILLILPFNLHLLAGLMVEVHLFITLFLN
jgi:hypothetical protein